MSNQNIISGVSSWYVPFLEKPLKWVIITQHFGKNPDMYKRFGLTAHNGIDFRLNTGTLVYPTHDGVVTKSAFDMKGFGYYVEITSNQKTYKTRYAHGDGLLVNRGDEVTTKTPILKGGNTGFSTGPHLHYDLKWINHDGSVKNLNNGYFGAVDPLPHFKPGLENLPVDERYGRKRNIVAEKFLRFYTPWVHRRLIKKYRRRPLQLTHRETNAIIYGGYGFDQALRDSLKPISYFMKKDEWVNGKKPYVRMIIG